MPVTSHTHSRRRTSKPHRGATATNRRRDPLSDVELIALHVEDLQLTCQPSACMPGIAGAVAAASWWVLLQQRAPTPDLRSSPPELASSETDVEPMAS